MRWLLLVWCIACGSNGGDTSDAGPADARVRPDARLAACGIEEPGSRCTGKSGLERCDGTAVVTEACGDGVCANVGDGAECVTLPRSCEPGLEPTCSGTIFTRCDQRQLQVVDCAVGGASCLVDDLEHASCATPCSAEDLDAQGRCVDGHIRRCGFTDGAFHVETVVCPSGTSCAMAGPDSGAPSCVPAGCPGLVATGSCDGDVLSRCVDGQVVTTRCADDGGVCAWGGELAGYGCAPAGTTGARRVSGVVTYEDRLPALAADGPVRVLPVRGAGVNVVDDASGRVLASAGTAEDGSYTLHFDAEPGTAVHVLAVAAGATRTRPVRVIHTTGLLHGFAGPAFAAGDDVTVDLLVTERSGSGGAFGILDTMIGGLDRVRALLEVEEPAPLVAIWSRGYRVLTGADGTTLYISGTFIDDDSFDEAVLLHELGHHVEMLYGRTSNPRQQHQIRMPVDPRLAWSEGWASYFGAVVSGQSRYIDSNLLGGFDFDIDDERNAANPAGGLTQPISENTVAEILWDLGDDATELEEDDDEVAGTHGDVVRVQSEIFRASTMNRGVAGIDLVDFLDGFLALAGATRCADTRAIVASRSFPYDFAGPVACPAP